MKISVILTSYNHEKFIEKSIKSVLNQIYQNFEFIIVDDCSTDSSWDIICQYKREYPQIITIRHDYNWEGGTVANTVQNYATGEYIALHHSDDVWEHDKLQKQVNIIQKHPEYVAVFSNAMAIDDNENEYDDEKGFYYNLFAVENRTRHEWLNYFFYHGNCLCHPSILVKRSVYEEEGFFRKGLRQIPDFVKWIQICKKHEIYVLPDKLVKFRVHNAGQNTSGMRADTQIRSTIELFLMLKEFEAIQEREEFLKIFPEAQKYCKGDFFSSDYALGRICTEEGMPAYTRLYGIQLLYKVLNDPDKAKYLKEEYHYTEKVFKEENGKYDIFGILPKAFEQSRSLYYDSGCGYNGEEVFTERFTLGDSGTFQFFHRFTLPDGKTIKGLRFDPAEGVMVKVELSQVLINGMQAKYLGENSLCCIEGKDIFVNLDPIYTILIPEESTNLNHLEVSIAGRVERLTDDEIMQTVMSVMYENRDTLSECQARIQNYQQEVQNYQAELDIKEETIQGQRNEIDEAHMQFEALQNIYSEINSELESLKDSRWYKCVVKIDSLIRLLKKEH